ncbi:MAG: hypothetical protein HEP71_00660 [Roseivirga sp.]|nr:hypothetical protein [Roseivirga sp.]
MGLPDVSINILNGQLGRTESTADDVAGLILTGPAPASLTSDTPTQIFSLADAEALGITSAYDTNDRKVHRQIADFYEMAGEGAELWISIVPDTTTMESICTVSNLSNSAKKLLDAAGGTIRLLGVTRTPDGVVTASGGFDEDVEDAVVKAQALAEAFALDRKPLRVMIEGRDYQGTPGAVKDYTQGTDNRVSVIALGFESWIDTGNGDAVTPSKAAAVGRALGAAAALPVQRKISRVKNGDLGLTEAFLSNGKSLAEVPDSELATLHDSGYIVPRTFTGINGFFFSSDRTATSEADDFSSLARGRVIDKAQVIAYQVLAREIEDDIVLNAENQLPLVVMKSYKANVETAFNAQMVSQGEASSAELILDASQDILANDGIQATISIIPTGYSSSIQVDLKFDNPTA